MNIKIIMLVFFALVIGSVLYALPIPCSADYDGDGIVDPAVYHSSQGYWEVLNSRFQYHRTVRYGLVNAIPVVGDFDGDGLADYACMIPETGEWLILLSSNMYRPISFTFGDEREYLGN